MSRRVAVGAFLGLAWGASLRAWMVPVAMQFGDPPKFTWLGTFAAVLLPAALVGAILGAAAHAAETSGGNRWRWAVLSPLLLPLAPILVDYNLLFTMFTTGIGSGAPAVALIGLLGGYALSGFGATWTRGASGLLALALALPLVYFSCFTDRAQAPSELFCSLTFVLLLALLVAGVSAPSRYRPGRHAPD